MHYPNPDFYTTIKFEAEERRHKATLFRLANLARKERRAEARALRKHEPWMRQRLPRPFGRFAPA